MASSPGVPGLSDQYTSLVRATLSTGQAAGLAAGIIVAVLVVVILCAALHDSSFFKRLRRSLKRCFCGPAEPDIEQPMAKVRFEKPKEKEGTLDVTLWLHYCLPCHVCGRLLRDPVTTETCHHVFCRDCLVPCVKADAKCPLCEQPAHGVVEPEPTGLHFHKQTHTQDIVLPSDEVTCRCCRKAPVGVYTACCHYACVPCTRKSLESYRGCPICHANVSAGGLTLLPRSLEPVATRT